MSTVYYYVNEDKKQYFPVGVLINQSSFASLGTGFAARALALLLTAEGTWFENRICVLHNENETWFSNYTNIRIEVELMLIDIASDDVLSQLIEQNTILFNKICNFAQILNHQKSLEFLDKKYGRTVWSKKQNSLQKNVNMCLQKEIYAAKERILKIYGN